ncbi:hypothetical protein XH89_32470 [Bradyrhizobium sp. CCBAU 53340]|nr:hypothetical protein XH89_32470 [Bradyrhizobium sp. CCBAU 53340]
MTYSPNYKIRGFIDFVQDQYFVRPGDKLMLAVAEGKTAQALQDWSEALDGIKIEIRYLDIFGKTFRYDRVISIKTRG